MIPVGYFKRSSRPAEGSPVAMLMRKIEAQCPKMDVEVMREQAREALRDIGGTSRVQDAYRKWLRCHSTAI